MSRWNVAVAAATALLSWPAIADAQMRVGPNVQVSLERPERNYGEMQIRAHPTDSATLIACSMGWRGAFSAGDANGLDVYFSRDAGRTWKFSTRFPGADPVCAMGADGTAYFHGSKVYRLPPGAAEWIVSDTSSKVGDDRWTISVDNTNGRYRGRVYVAALTGAESTEPRSTSVSYIGVWHSKDGARTFRSSRPIISLPPRGGYMPASEPAAILSDGTVLVGYTEQNGEEWLCKADKRNARFLLMKSTDGGETFSSSSIASICSDHDEGNATPIPAFAADGTDGPLKGRLYAAWPDRRTGNVEVMFSFSTDTGKTWSKPVIIDAARKPGVRRNDLTPRLAVNKNGVVGIAWGNRQDYSDNLTYDQRFTASYDGGVTWLPSVRVSTVPASWEKNESFPLNAQSNPAGGTYAVRLHKFAFTGGDYAGLDADAAGVFHLLWADNRNVKSQLWTATVTVPGVASPLGNAAAAAPGTPLHSDLDQCVSLKSRVGLVLDTDSTHFDQKQRLVTLHGRLRNLTDQTVKGPFIVRVMHAASALGAPAAVNSVNKQSHDGAQWEFKDITLAPKAESGLQKFVFRIDNYVPPGGTLHMRDIIESAAPSFFTFTAEVFGPVAH
jgi:hypothetical protein